MSAYRLLRTYAPRIAAIGLVIASAVPASAQTAANVALVINESSADSRQIGEHYARRRAIPEENVIRIAVSPDEAMSRDAYVDQVERPIGETLGQRRLQDRILYIVLTKGVPLRIVDAKGATTGSVDSELTLLYRKQVGTAVAAPGRIANPYFLGQSPVAEAQPFSRRAHDIYLVTRLDGFSVQDVVAIIDRAEAPRDDTRRRFVFDQRSSLLSNPAGDLWLADAGRRLATLGFGESVLLESTRAPVRNVEDVVGFYSWGANDPQHRVRRVGVRFVPRALAVTFDSSSARTFQEPPAEWVPSGEWRDAKTFFAGTPESLVGDLIRDGVTGAAGYVADPFLQGTVRPEVLFPAYARGFNLAEAFYLALPHLRWQAVIIGDPLCEAFQRKGLGRPDAEAPIDPQTELPGLFSQRRLAALQATLSDAPPDALRLMVLAESRAARGDRPGARAALQKAVTETPSLLAARLQLALLHELDGESVLAISQYQEILQRQPRNVIALNNLAYAMAVHQGAATEAKALAEKAMALAPRESRVVDTLAWIEHLLGNTATALRLIENAARMAPTNPEIRLHSAFIHAAAGALDTAAVDLAAALALNPALGERADVLELQKRLPAKSPADGSSLANTDKIEFDRLNSTDTTPSDSHV
jgi:uncharacterized protein (TIGR03790 family)